MVDHEAFRERELLRTLEQYEYILGKRDDVVATQRFVIISLVVLLAGVIAVMAIQC